MGDFFNVREINIRRVRNNFIFYLIQVFCSICLALFSIAVEGNGNQIGSGWVRVVLVSEGADRLGWSI